MAHQCEPRDCIDVAHDAGAKGLGPMDAQGASVSAAGAGFWGRVRAAGHGSADKAVGVLKSAQHGV